MKVEIDLPISLVGFIKSLDVEELNDDKIINEVSTSEYYYDVISFGLINHILNEDEEDEYYLTRIGKTVYETNF